MTSYNPHTGKAQKTPPTTKTYETNWDKIFSKTKPEEPPKEEIKKMQNDGDQHFSPSVD